MRPNRYSRQKPAPKAHEIPEWLGAPLWAFGRSVKQNWKSIAWAASLIIALYLPNVLHTHAHARDNARCDRINYAALVAYQYGCTGRDCSAEKAEYEQIVQLAIGTMLEDCHPNEPWTPSQQLASWGGAYSRLTASLSGIIPPEKEPETLEVAEVTG